ncbi:MAG TPA: thiamine biosynthesis protein ThiS [Desulfosporosinus sp.]|nr:thiamine biosynthesis protein ThiS [Desulfosporosinus sp.]
MIKVNGRDYPWRAELSVKQLLAEMNFTFPLIIVVINGKTVPKDEFTCTVIENGDDIQAIHLICGG